jgi:hypothetical protein
MTAAIADSTPAPSGTAWTLTNKQYSWWKTAAIASGMAGLVAVVPHRPIATIEASMS